MIEFRINWYTKNFSFYTSIQVRTKWKLNKKEENWEENKNEVN